MNPSLKSQLVESISTRAERVYYQGKILDHHIKAEVNRPSKYRPYYQQYEKSPYNYAQNLLYKRVLYGLSMFSKEDLAKMNSVEKSKINSVHKKAQRELNLWKNRLLKERTDIIFSIFTNSSLAKKLLEPKKPTNNYMNTLNFADLGVSKPDIINHFVEVGILPNNFNKL
jgi:hypothetical protein